MTRHIGAVRPTDLHPSIPMQEGAAPQAVFDPLSLAPAGLWLSENVTLAGNLVNSWNDTSGNAHHVTQTFARRPIWTDDVLNGHPTVTFDGSNDILGPTLYTRTHPRTVLAIFDSTALVNGTYILMGNTSDSGILYLDAGGTIIMYDGTQFISRDRPANGWHAALMKFDGASSEFSFDGDTPKLGTCGQTSMGGICFGAASTGGLSAAFASVAFEDIGRVITRDEEKDLLRWASSEYNLALSAGRWIKGDTAAPWRWRDGPFCAVINGRLYMCGGWNTDLGGEAPGFHNYTTAEVWSAPLTDLTDWQQEPDAPWERRHLAAHCMHNGHLVIAGGDTYQGHYQRDMWEFDGTTWTQLTADWGAGIGDRMFMSMWSLNGVLYLGGGQTLEVGIAQTIYSDLHSWDPVSGTWSLVTNVAPWQGGCMCGPGAVSGNYLYVVLPAIYGVGLTPESYDPGIYRWSVADGWETVTADCGLLPRKYATAAFLGLRMWTWSGYNAGPTNLNDCHYSDDGGVSWTELTDTPWLSTHAAGVGVTADAIYHVAGNVGLLGCWYLESV